jgi:hypothetical protein
MLSDDAEARLRALLSEAGVDISAPTAQDVERTWAVMRSFTAEDVEDVPPREDDGDSLLAQYGVFPLGGPPLFELDMTRVLRFVDEEGEHDHLCHLQCTFAFEPDDALRTVGSGNLSSFGLEAGDFFAQALALPGFRAVRELAIRPLRLEIIYTEV